MMMMMMMIILIYVMHIYLRNIMAADFNNFSNVSFFHGLRLFLNILYVKADLKSYNLCEYLNQHRGSKT
jgi:hypothetical protein